MSENEKLSDRLFDLYSKGTLPLELIYELLDTDSETVRANLRELENKLQGVENKLKSEGRIQESELSALLQSSGEIRMARVRNHSGEHPRVVIEKGLVKIIEEHPPEWSDIEVSFRSIDVIKGDGAKQTINPVVTLPSETTAILCEGAAPQGIRVLPLDRAIVAYLPSERNVANMVFRSGSRDHDHQLIPEMEYAGYAHHYVRLDRPMAVLRSVLTGERGPAPEQDIPWEGMPLHEKTANVRILQRHLKVLRQGQRVAHDMASSLVEDSLFGIEWKPKLLDYISWTVEMMEWVQQQLDNAGAGE
jgi:hypothetical protein